MEWMMILTAMSLKSPDSEPAGIVKLKFETQQQCEQTLATLEYKLDLGMFVNEKDWIVEGQCSKIK
jgi:hypothetical protein